MIIQALFSLFLSSMSFAQSKDLSAQFPVCHETILGPKICSVYSSTLLLEAACYRKTGKQVKVSMLSFFRKALFQKIIKEKNPSWFFLGQDPEFLKKYPREADQWNRRIYLMGLGDPLTPYLDLHSSEITTEDELPWSEDTLRSIYEIFPKIDRKYSKEFLQERNTENRKILVDKLGIDFWTEFESVFFKLLEKNGTKKEEVIKTGFLSKNESLKSCFQKGISVRALGKKQLQEKGGESYLVSLLERNYPFLCLGEFSYGSQGSGDHAWVVVGYKKQNQKLEFLIRDSNKPEKTYYTTQTECRDGIVYLVDKKDEE